MAVPVVRHRFTVEDYYRMAAAGVLTEADRVELIEGEIVDMTPIGSRHMACVNRFTELLSVACRGRAIVQVQGPIRLGPHSEPQPDVALLRPRADFYATGHPGPGAVLLAIEVADTSLDFDRTVKLPLYARHGVPEVWLVDLAAGRMEVCRRPTAAGYGETSRAGRGERLSPLALPDVAVAVDDVLV
jgi:Uma2 family endonuclease